MTVAKINIAVLNESSASERARAFWELDLADAESAMGVDSSIIKSFKVDDADDRVPRQGFVLNKFDYLKD